MRFPCWMVGHEWRQSTPSEDGMAFVKCVECGGATLATVTPDAERDALLLELMSELASDDVQDATVMDVERAIREALRPLPRVAA